MAIRTKAQNAAHWYQACAPVIAGLDEGTRDELFARLEHVAAGMLPGASVVLDDDGLACALQAWAAQADPTPAKVAAAVSLAAVLNARDGLHGREPVSARLTYDIETVDPSGPGGPRPGVEAGTEESFRARWACAGEWQDRGERVCGRHGYAWPSGQPHCNDERGQIAYEALSDLGSPVRP